MHIIADVSRCELKTKESYSRLIDLLAIFHFNLRKSTKEVIRRINTLSTVCGNIF